MMLSGRVAIVSGGAGGIGRAIALKYAEEGCSVAIADINLAAARETAPKLSGPGTEGLALQCDATDGRQVKDVIDQVVRKFGKIDILVNNAGGMSSAPPIEDMEEGLWDKVVDLNLKSNYLFCKAVVPFMKGKKYGKIINLSSIGAINPPRHSIHYNSAKAGVIGFTYDLAYALAPFNINVNVILPGLIRTDFYNGVAGLSSDQQKDGFFGMLGKMVPLQRIGTPEDIAGAALFLASDLAAYVTGTSLVVSGGLPLSPQPEAHDQVNS
jgi:3-oxoacyl-[acyl-carrier protein] reductase